MPNSINPATGETVAAFDEPDAAGDSVGVDLDQLEPVTA